MYYIYKDEETKEHKILPVDEPTTDGTYGAMKLLFNIKGQFGRKDFAQIWCDFYNGLFDRTVLRQKLDAITV